MSQLALDGFDPAEAAVLTERQELALTLIRELGPLTSTDLGWRLRELRGLRPTGAEFDQSSGRKVGDALAAKGLVRHRRGEGWVEVYADGTAAGDPDRPYAYDPKTAAIPF